MAYSALYYFWLILISSSSSYSPLQMDSSTSPIPVEQITWRRAPLLRAVGDGIWDVPVGSSSINYTVWASHLTFYVGDKLEFKYDKARHNLLQVNKVDYYNCDNHAASAVYKDGDTIITLNTSGVWYFTCGNIDHCKAGQKLALLVDPTPPNSPSSSSLPPVSTPADGALDEPSPSLAPSELPFTTSQIPFMPHPSSIGVKNMPFIMFWFMVASVVQWLVTYI